MGTDNPTVVLMAGLPCTGKTTLAYALQDELGWSVVDKDWYKAELLKQGIEDDSASRTAYNDSFEKIDNALANQQSVIMDCAALRPFIINEIVKIIYVLPDARLKVILCLADRDLRVERLQTRTHSNPNPKVDTTTDVDDLFHFGHLPSDELKIIRTDKPIAVCLAEAKEHIFS